MTETHTGACLCGQVRYTVAGDPLMVGICHCRNCQRQSGAPFSVVWGVADTAFAQDGDTRTYIDNGDSGQVVHRLFCAGCGSPIRSRADAAAGISFIKAGTLDRPDRFAPTFEVYCDRAWNWLPSLAAARHPLAFMGETQ
jgi:hypothetical protein